MNTAEYLNQRRQYSAKRLSALSKRIARIPELRRFSRFSIYVTGSFVRLEASNRSDLDLFFILDDSVRKNGIDKLSKTLIDAALIRIATNMSFPEFTNQGQYLEIHPLLDIVKYLGGPDDDFQNHFTARMLLLLES